MISSAFGLFIEFCIDCILFIFTKRNFIAVAVFNVHIECVHGAVFDLKRPKVPVASVVLNEYVVLIGVSVVDLECSDAELTIVVMIVMIVMIVIVMIVVIVIVMIVMVVVVMIVVTSIAFWLCVVLIETASQRANCEQSCGT